MKEFILILPFLISINVYAEEYKATPIENVEMTCGNEISQSIEWSYCISRTKNSNNQNVLYHLHGRKGNASWWNDKDYHTGKIHNEWIKNEVDPPTVISISFGGLWFLLKNKNNSGLINIFLQNIISKVEGKLSFNPIKRSIMGISMGGLNTFYLSMSNSSMFEKAAILCAHIPFITHHDGFLKVLKYSFEHNISLKRSYMMYKMSQKFYSDKKTHELNSSQNLIGQFNADLSPELYITCGEKDDWGCMKSSKMVAEKIKEKDGKVTWTPRLGGHCDLNHEEIARFLVN